MFKSNDVRFVQDNRKCTFEIENCISNHTPQQMLFPRCIYDSGGAIVFSL